MLFEIVHYPEQTMGSTIGIAPIDGSSPPVELTERGYRDWGPHPSPDGQTILFYRDAIGHRGSLAQEVWLMDPDGANKRMFWEKGQWGFTDAGHFVFSPDGTEFCFAANHKETKSFAIYTIGVDGTGVDQITTGNEGLDADPAWLPDGRIVFTRRLVVPSNKWGVWPHSQEVHIADGDTVSRLTFDEKEGLEPEAEWDVFCSPNGERFVMLRMTSDLSLSPFDNWVMDVDGANRRRVHDGSMNGGIGVARWMKDSKRVLTYRWGRHGFDTVLYDVDKPDVKTVILPSTRQSGFRQPIQLPR